MEQHPAFPLVISSRWLGQNCNAKRAAPHEISTVRTTRHLLSRGVGPGSPVHDAGRLLAGGAVLEVLARFTASATRRNKSHLHILNTGFQISHPRLVIFSTLIDIH